MISRARLLSCLALLSLLAPTSRADWTQGGGPLGDFTLPEVPGPIVWSAVRDEQIVWRLELPETGQSPVIVAGGKAFFTHYAPLEGDAEVAKDIVARCVDAKTGEPLWERPIEGRYPLRLSGCFGDSTSPAPVTDGEHVVFINASGTIACFDLNGEPKWSRELLTTARTVPFLHGDFLVFTRQIYPPDEGGNFTHEHENAPREQWTQLQAVVLATGEDAWTTTCGVNMGCLPLPQRRLDGRHVAVVGRGGGHAPPERPEGISLVDLDTGETLWTRPLDGFMSTISFSLFEKHVIVYHGHECLWVNANTGEIDDRISILERVPSRIFEEGEWTSKVLTIPPSGKGREITQGSNLKVGHYSFFRSYQRNLVGRVDLRQRRVDYLMLPTQMLRRPEKKDRFHWSAEGSIDPFKPKKKPGPLALHEWALRHNEVRNRRGHLVMGDARSQGNGWGHIASPTPVALGDHLYFTSMSGIVYVLDWNSTKWDETAWIATNDLGPLGKAWTRTHPTFANGLLYTHTIGEVMAIKAPKVEEPEVTSSDDADTAE